MGYIYGSPKEIYFIQGKTTGLIKIGQSSNVKRRLKDMQAGSPDVLVLLGTATFARIREGLIHRAFKTGLAHGEWFKPGERLLEFIRLFTTQ